MPRRPPTRRAAARTRTPVPGRLDLALVAVLLAAGVLLRLVHLPVEVYTPDEDAYANFYAVPIVSEGPGALPRLLRDYNTRPEMWNYPPPTRIGHLLPIAGIMSLSADASVQTAALVSMIASVAILLLLAHIGLRFLGGPVAAIALLFAAVSPLDLAMARRAWGDELFAACALVSLLAFLRHAAGGRRTGSMVVCLAAAGYSTLVKENGLLVLGLASGGLAWVGWRAKGPGGAVRPLIAGAAVAVAVLTALVISCGGFGPLATTFRHMTGAVATNEYVRAYQTGGPDYYARGLLLLQPLPATLGLVAALLAIARPGLVVSAVHPDTSLALRVLAGVTLAFIAVAVVWPQKNLRFLSAIYGPIDLLAAALVWGLVQRIRGPAAARRLTAAFVSVALLAAAFADHRRFVDLFERRGIPDLATPWFTRPQGPGP